MAATGSNGSNPVFLNLSQLASAAKSDNQSTVVLNMAAQAKRTGAPNQAEGGSDNFNG